MPTSSLITCQQMAFRLLRFLGVTSFLPQPYGSELESITNPNDLWDVANAINGAIQEMIELGPAEARQAPVGDFLNPPTQLSLSCTFGSTAVSAVTTYLSWMQGCTIRITGDAQDNELLGPTTLARPFMGPTGATSATIFGDCVTLPVTIGKVMAPVWVPNQNFTLWPATNLSDFMRLGNYPQVMFNGAPFGNPSQFFPVPLYFAKPIGIPCVWFVDGAYDPTVGYVQRRIRIAPMPQVAYPLAYTAGLNPPRITPDDIVAPAYSNGANIVVTNITNTTAGNQTYAFLTSLGTQAVYRGVTTNSWYIFPNLAASGNYIIANSFTPEALPSAYWASGTNVIPTGTSSWIATGSATGTASVAPNFASVVTSDPGTVLPVPNAWVESILLPIALKRFSGMPLFKNDKALPEIDRQYKAALAALRDCKGQESTPQGYYPQ